MMRKFELSEESYFIYIRIVLTMYLLKKLFELAMTLHRLIIDLWFTLGTNFKPLHTLLGLPKHRRTLKGIGGSAWVTCSSSRPYMAHALERLAVSPSVCHMERR